MINTTKFSRRGFTRVLGAGFAYAALQPSTGFRLSGVRTIDEPKRVASVVRLSSNENPYGPSPAALKAWYAATGVFPADKRFPASLVTDPIAKKMLALDQSAVSVWPENFVPPQVDQNADLAAGELITSGSGSPAQAVKLWVSELSKWKSQHPDEFKNYQKWVTEG